MCKIFIGYNINKINSQLKREVVKRLYHNFSNLNLKSDILCFGKIQIVYSNFNPRKLTINKHNEILLVVSGSVTNQSKVLNNTNFTKLDDYLIHQYQKSISSLKKVMGELSGHYSVFLYNKKNDTIHIFSDKLSSYGSYYYNNGKKFIYSNSVEAMLSIKEIERKINFDAIADVITLGVIQNNETLIKSICNLPPCSHLFWQKNKYYIKPYFSFSHIESSEKTDFHLDKINSILNDVILNNYTRCKNSHLTGGFDTRLINSILLNKGIKPNIYFKKDQRNTNHIDHIISKEFSDFFNLKLNTFAPGHEPLPIQSGLFGGELLGTDINQAMSMSFQGPTPDLCNDNIFTKEFECKLSRKPNDYYFKQLKNIPCTDKNKKEYLYKFSLTISPFYNSLGAVGYWVRKRKWFQVDRFYPYLDSDFLAALFKIPFKKLWNRKFYNKLVEKYYQDYFKIPIIHDKKFLYHSTNNKLKLIKVYSSLSTKNDVDNTYYKKTKLTNIISNTPVLKNKNSPGNQVDANIEIINNWIKQFT